VDAPDGRIVADEAIGDLRELAVVEQVVLEPQHDLAVVGREPRVARAQVGERLGPVGPAA
jgi:hypothetical protein